MTCGCARLRGIMTRPSETRSGICATTFLGRALHWCVAACLVSLAASADAQTVTLSGSVVGSTPATLGYNLGHFHNNQTASWWRYSGANGARMFTSPSDLTPTSLFKSSTNASLNATTQTQFLQQITALRNSGTATTYINWSGINSNYTSNVSYGNNSIDAQFADATVQAAGGKTLVVMQRLPSTYAWPTNPTDSSSADWQNRWIGWQQWYAQAFVRARYEDVENFQLFNEPDLYGSGLSQSQWIEMMKYGANAVESAIADVNRIFGKTLKAHVYGPVTNGPSLTTAGGTDWGDTLLQNRNTPMLSGSAVPSYQLFDHFDYHNYGSSPTTFGSKLAGAISDVNTLTGGQGSKYPVTISEFNTRTSANYDPTDPVNNPSGYTPDSLAMSSRLGQIVTNLANNKPDELYLFKFSDAGGANNGVHWQSGAGDVGGISKSGMVYHLFTEGFTGNSLLAAPSTTDADVSLAASQSASTGTRYVFATNANLSSGKSLTLNLSTWNVAPGTVVTVEQVSNKHQGDISQTITVGADRTITVDQDPGGVVLVKVPSGAGVQRTTIVASNDAYVNQGSRSSTFNGAELLVKNGGSAKADRSVTFLKFSLAGLDPAAVKEAMLSITARDPGATDPNTAGIIAHVYGLTSTSWSQGSITWSNAPNLNDPGTTISTIGDNYVSGIGSSAEIIGQFAATGTEQLLSIDVSRWALERLAAGASNLTFMITRDIRFDGDVDASHSLSIRSTEYAGGAFAPTLTVTAVPEPATLVLLAAAVGGIAVRRRALRAGIRQKNGS